MKTVLSLLILAIFLTLCPHFLLCAAETNSINATTDIAEVRDRLLSKARESGEVRVIVEVRDAQPLPEDGRSREEIGRDRTRRIWAAQGALLEHMSRHRLSRVKRFRHIPFMAMKVDEAALRALLSNPSVTVEEDKVREPMLTESVPLVGADLAWNAGYTGAGWAVAILDTGVDTTHPFFTGRTVAEACFSSNLCPNGQDSQIGPGAGKNCTTSSTCYHGTHVAGIALGALSTINGVARGANLIPVQIATNISGRIAFYDSDIIQGLEHVYDLRNDYQIASVNMSLGTSTTYSNQTTCDTNDPSIKAAIDMLRSAGIATVIAAGNSRRSTGLSSPACISGSISVGATTKADAVDTDYSNSASFLSLLAPGTDIYSSVPNDGWATKSGTSMATPHVAGAWAVLKQAKPSATVDEILGALTSTGRLIRDPRNNLSKPRIQVNAAVSAIVPPGPPYALVVNKSGAGIVTSDPAGISCGADCSESYAENAQVTLTATPSTGYLFTGWTGCDSTNGNQCTVTMTVAKEVLVSFTYASTIPLGEGVDDPAHTYTTGGSAEWQVDGDVFYYGNDATRSGAVGAHQVSWMETSVTGPTEVFFYWKVSSHYIFGWLTFYIDGVWQTTISGERDWHQRSFSIGPGSHTLKWEYLKDFEASNDGSDAGWVDRVTFGPFISLENGVDDTSRTYTTGGDANWYGQSSVSYNDGDAAMSGRINGDNRMSWMETSVTGPGNFAFYWKVSSEPDGDFLRFYIDGIEQNAISGEVDWQQQSYDLSSGVHTVRWEYTKNLSTFVGFDAGWVNKVIFTPPPASDTVGPALTITNPSSGTSTVNTSTFTGSGTATDSGNGDNGIAQVTVNGVRASNDTATGSGTASWSRTISLSAGSNTITVIATDGVGNSTTRTATVILDATAPSLTISTPYNGQSVSAATIAVSGTATDSGRGDNGIAQVTVNGVRASNDTATGSGTASWSRTISLNVGSNTITVIATDGVGNTTSNSITVTRTATDATAPSLTIRTPYNGQRVTTATIAVSGTATDSGRGDSGIAQVTVNGVRASNDTATGSGTTSWSITISLSVGSNTITVIATDGVGNSTTRSITVTRTADTTAPSLTITRPYNGQRVTTATVAVYGTATDSGRGNNGIAQVTVNGVRASNDTATGSGRASWSRTISLTIGSNTITVSVTDGVGNVATKSVTVTRTGTAALVTSPPSTIKTASGHVEETTRSHPLTLRTIGTGSGTVTSLDQKLICPSLCSASLPEDSQITLIATPDVSSVFTGWSGGSCEGIGECTIPISREATVNASFTDTSYPVALFSLDKANNTLSIIGTETKIITTGKAPSAIVVAPSGMRAYVAADNTVSVIDTLSQSVLAVIPVGNAPSSLLLNAPGTTLYVTNSGDGTISLIDTATNLVVSTIPGAAHAIDPEERYLYEAGAEGILVCNPVTGAIIATIPMDPVPSLAAAPNGAYLYAATGTNVSLIDTVAMKVVGTIPTGPASHAIAIHPSGEKVYVVSGDGTISIIDTATRTAFAVSAGPSPSALAISPTGDRLYVSCSNGIAVIDTATANVLSLLPITGQGGLAAGQAAGKR